MRCAGRNKRLLRPCKNIDHALILLLLGHTHDGMGLRQLLGRGRAHVFGFIWQTGGRQGCVAHQGVRRIDCARVPGFCTGCVVCVQMQRGQIKRQKRGWRRLLLRQNGFVRELCGGEKPLDRHLRSRRVCQRQIGGGNRTRHKVGGKQSVGQDVWVGGSGRGGRLCCHVCLRQCNCKIVAMLCHLGSRLLEIAMVPACALVGRNAITPLPKGFQRIGDEFEQGFGRWLAIRQPGIEGAFHFPRRFAK